MLGINYIKFDPMSYVILYQNGKVAKKGKGLSFFYTQRNSSIVAIPLSSKDVPFVFKEVTQDYQHVTVQGQLTYRIRQPENIDQQLNFTVNAEKKYVSDDYEKLNQRLINEAQASVSAFVHSFSITEILSRFIEIRTRLFEGLRNSDVVQDMGIEIMSVNILGITADPEMARALEARTREALQQEADKAIYDRRNFAVEQERKIKETELNTTIAIEEKQKEIVEKKMETDLIRQDNERRLKRLSLEARLETEKMNRDLVKLKSENQKEAADAKGYQLEAIMKVYKDVDWRILDALNSEGGAKNNIALAFRELASNPKKIGNLNITPDLFSSLLNSD